MPFIVFTLVLIRSEKSVRSTALFSFILLLLSLCLQTQATQSNADQVRLSEIKAEGNWKGCPVNSATYLPVRVGTNHAGALSNALCCFIKQIYLKILNWI